MYSSTLLSFPLCLLPVLRTFPFLASRARGSYEISDEGPRNFHIGLLSTLLSSFLSACPTHTLCTRENFEMTQSTETRRTRVPYLPTRYSNANNHKRAAEGGEKSNFNEWSSVPRLRLICSLQANRPIELEPKWLDGHFVTLKAVSFTRDVASRGAQTHNQTTLGTPEKPHTHATEKFVPCVVALTSYLVCYCMKRRGLYARPQVPQTPVRSNA